MIPKTNDFLKKGFDFFFSLSSLIVLSPLFLLIALCIKINSQGPVFYFQKRIGKNKKPFFIWKFRTMYANADLALEDLLKKDASLRDEWKKNWKLKDDPRITTIGKFLRKTSFDELPQLWNIFKGDMSVVGPRPVVEYEVTHYFKEKAEKILSVRPGLTGLWQVSGRNDLSYPDRVRLNEEYVDRQSFFLDMQLIAKTIWIVFSSKGTF